MGVEVIWLIIEKGQKINVSFSKKNSFQFQDPILHMPCQNRFHLCEESKTQQIVKALILWP